MGLRTAVIIVLVIIFFIIGVVSSWIIYVHLRARRLGLPPPTFSSYNPFVQPSSYSGPRPAPGGIIGWVNDRIRLFKNRNSRLAGGAYEEPLSSNIRGRGRGFGPLDPDDAWDARVGTEADAYGPGGYYEEQELGLTGGIDTAYEGAGSAANERGRGRNREPEPYIGGSKAGMDRRYDEETGKRQSHDPFSDEHAETSNLSLRGVSPRPVDGSLDPGKGHKKKDSEGDSPTERRSMFQEQM